MFVRVAQSKDTKLYNNVDVVTIRKNTEGEYSGIEHEVNLKLKIFIL